MTGTKRKGGPKPPRAWHRVHYGHSGQYALTPADAERLCNSIGDVQDEAMIRLAIACGIRREDIVRIPISNVDLEHGTITFEEKKKKNRARTADLGGKVMPALERQIRLVGRHGRWLFPSKLDPRKHTSSRTAYNRFNYWLVRNGLDKRPFHALRSTFIKLAQAKGWSIEAVAEMVGDTVAVVQEHYSRPSRDEMQRLAREKPIL